MFEWFNLVYAVIGGLVTMIGFLVKNSYRAGEKTAELATKRELQKKIDDLESSFNKKFCDIDDRVDRKVSDIDKSLNRINETLAKQEAREEERSKYEKIVKESERAALDRISALLTEYNKNQDELIKMVYSRNPKN
jgi:hypothetical protein